MGRPEIDISGLQVFYVNKIISTKMEDGSVMVICGFKFGESFTPLYATISPAAVAIEDGQQYVEVARMAGGTHH